MMVAQIASVGQTGELIMAGLKGEMFRGLFLDPDAGAKSLGAAPAGSFPPTCWRSLFVSHETQVSRGFGLRPEGFPCGLCEMCPGSMHRGGLGIHENARGCRTDCQGGSKGKIFKKNVKCHTASSKDGDTSCVRAATALGAARQLRADVWFGYGLPKRDQGNVFIRVSAVEGGYPFRGV